VNIVGPRYPPVTSYHIKFIQKHYQELRKTFNGKEWDGGLLWLTKPLSLGDFFGGKAWAMMWSTYALFDPSYQNQESFGFFIDVGNGYSTIPPCVLVNLAILFPEKCSPLLVGCVAIASYWQVLYGTLIYLLSFMFNQRYKGKNAFEVGCFVGLTNGVWIVFPCLGIFAAVSLLRDGNFDIFSGPS